MIPASSSSPKPLKKRDEERSKGEGVIYKPKDGDAESDSETSAGSVGVVDIEPPKAVLRRFHGAVTLDPMHLGRDAGLMTDEVISHLQGLVGSNVIITLEVLVEVP